MAAGCWASTWWERGSPKGHADADAAGVGGRVALVQGDLEALPVAADSVEGLGNSPASMHQPTVEAAIAAAGFEVVRRERIASEWSEYQLEHDPGYLTQDLLEVARLTRDRDHREATLGPVWYRRALGFASWRLQIVLGRLMPVLYALRKRATNGGPPNARH
jgi:hypothetical protein